MIGNRKSEQLYTVVQNNTSATMRLAAFGSVRSAAIRPGQAQSFVGYIFQGLSDGRLSSVYKAISSGAITVYLMVRNPDGAYTKSVLGVPRTGVVYDDTVNVSVENKGEVAYKVSKTKKAKEAIAKEAATVKDKILSDPREESFNVRASGNNDTIEQYGVRVSDEQPYARSPRASVTETAAESVYGFTKVGTKTAETLATDNKSAEEAAAAEEPVITVKKEAVDHGNLAELVADCYKNKDWTVLIRLLQDEWPEVEFNKRSVMNLKSLDGIIKKYQLS